MPTSPQWRPGLVLTLVALVITACSGQPATPAGGPVAIQASLGGGLAALSADTGGEVQATLALLSSDQRPLSYQASSDSDWLTLPSGSGVLAAGQQATLPLQAHCGQQAETRVGHLSVTFAASGAAPLALSAEVRLTCTLASDTTPDTFEFAPQTGVAPSARVTSNPVTVAGINTPTPVTVTGATLLVNGQPSSQASVRAGDVVALQLSAPDTYASSVTARLTIGGVTADFGVTTQLPPNAPTPGPLTLSASALQFTATGADQRQSFTASQANYSGSFAVGGTCQTIATVTASQPTNSLTVAVTPTAAGRCVVRVSSAVETQTVTVTVTTSGVVVN